MRRLFGWLGNPLFADESNERNERSETIENRDRPVQVFILLGQSNMLGFGKIKPADKEGTLQHATQVKGLYPYLTDENGKWNKREDVRNVRVMGSGTGKMSVKNNDWLEIRGKIGPEIGIGHQLGEHLDAPVMLIKSCIGIAVWAGIFYRLEVNLSSLPIPKKGRRGSMLATKSRQIGGKKERRPNP